MVAFGPEGGSRGGETEGEQEAPIPCKIVPRKENVTPVPLNLLPFKKRDQELGYEISCLLDVMMLSVFCFSIGWWVHTCSGYYYALQLV